MPRFNSNFRCLESVAFLVLALGLGIVHPTVSKVAASEQTSLCDDEEFPAELIHFEPAIEKPVFESAGPGTWEIKIRERGWIMKDGGVWKLWYSGFDGVRGNPVHLGYATSDDGIHWTRHPNNPLLPNEWIEDVCVVKESGTWYLFAEGKDDVPHWFQSTNGIDWKRQGELDVRRYDGTPVEKGPLGTPVVIKTKRGWSLFYERSDAGVWLAHSNDLKFWTNVQDEPVLRRDPDGNDSQMIALNQVIEFRGRFYAYYHASRTPERPRLWTCNVASSTDLIHWKKYPGNPLRPESENKSSPLLILDDHDIRFYTTHDKIDLHRPRSVGTARAVR